MAHKQIHYWLKDKQITITNTHTLLITHTITRDKLIIDIHCSLQNEFDEHYQQSQLNETLFENSKYTKIKSV